MRIALTLLGRSGNYSWEVNKFRFLRKLGMIKLRYVYAIIVWGSLLMVLGTLIGALPSTLKVFSGTGKDGRYGIGPSGDGGIVIVGDTNPNDGNVSGDYGG